MRGPAALSLIMLPFVPLVLGYGFFAGACQDDFCPALLWEAGVGLVAASAIVATMGSILLSRGRGVWRAGAAAWSTAIAVGALVFSGSQFYEGDIGPAVVGLIMMLAASFFAWSAARSPYSQDGVPA